MTRAESDYLPTRGMTAGAGPAAAFSASMAAALLAASPALAESPLLAELRDRVETAYHGQDPTGLEAARLELLAVASGQVPVGARPALLGAETPDPGPRAAYLAAFARFRQALATPDRAGARAFLEDCIGELTVHVDRHPADAEARALLGSCLGLSTRYQPAQYVSRGLESRRQLDAARRLAPDNPWVILQDGLGDWATPALFGGSRARALGKLERAADLFTAAAAGGSRAATWAAAETFLQLGPRYEAMGRAKDARAAFARASALLPVSAGGHRQLAAAW